MKNFISLLLALSVLASICLMPVQATEAVSEVYTANDNMWMQSVTLRTQEGKEGIFYSAIFKFSQDELDAMDTYGLALSTTQLTTNDAWTQSIQGQSETKVLTSEYLDMASLPADKFVQKNSTSLVNIININNDTITNSRNLQTRVYVRPYACIDGAYTYGAVASCSMLEVLQGVNSIYAGLTDTQLKGMLGMYERFSTLLNRFDLTDIRDDYYGNEAEGIDANPLILEYRRDKVVANMQAQADLLWSFTGERFKYSRTPKSAGYDYDDQNGVFTLYPGRIYKGIPYTHAAGSIDVFYTLGEKNSDGVYELGALNSSMLNGDSTKGFNDGINEGDTYSVSRLGNDCWDAIAWAYESVGSSVTANSVYEAIPAFGMYPVGDYDLSLFLVEEGNYMATSSDVYHAHFENNEPAKQTVYESYAQMQRGDALIRTLSTGGHCLMVVSVDVVRRTDGTIDPDLSTVTIIEQATNHERMQSTDFDVDNLTDQAEVHASEHSDKNLSATCKQCAQLAGYDEQTGIWTLNAGQITNTLSLLFDRSYYVPVTSRELTDATFKPGASRITDTLSDFSVADIFDGTLSSTYRVSQVTLDIFGGDGNKVNTSTCFSARKELTDGFALSRFVTDQTVGAYGSVLHGTPALVQESKTDLVVDENGDPVYVYTEAADGTYYYDETTGAYVEVTEEVAEGTILYTKTQASETTTWLEAPSLAEGEYYYTMTCTLGNGRVLTFRSGFFTVALGENTAGEANSHLVSAS